MVDHWVRSGTCPGAAPMSAAPAIGMPGEKAAGEAALNRSLRFTFCVAGANYRRDLAC